MTTKFGRNYRIKLYRKRAIIQPPPAMPIWETISDALLIEYPITCQFLIVRNIGGSFNTCDIQLFNLSETTRRKIFQDRFSYDVSSTAIEQTVIELEAGYGADLHLIYKGIVAEAGSTRRGTEFVTYITSTDNALMANSTQTFKTLNVKNDKELLQALANEFAGELQVGTITGNDVIFNRPVSVSGNTWEFMQRYSNDNVYIDLGKIYSLKDFEVINENAVVIDATTGLLDTPRRDNGYIEFTTLFEPTVELSQQIQIISSVQQEYNTTFNPANNHAVTDLSIDLYDKGLLRSTRDNGLYKIQLIKHDCVISGAIGGKCQTTIGAFANNRIFKKFEFIGAT